MSRTDEGAGEAEPADPPSRARMAGHGWAPWTAGLAVAAAQVLVLALAQGGWRVEGAVGLALVALGGVGFAVFGGGGDDERAGGDG